MVAAGERDERRVSGRLLIEAHERHVHVEEQCALRIVAHHAFDPEEGRYPCAARDRRIADNEEVQVERALLYMGSARRGAGPEKEEV